MKKLFVISIMLVASIAFAAAQQGQGRGGTPEERAKRQVDRLTELLTLNADQKKKIEAIEIDLNKQFQTKLQNAQGNADARRAVMQEMQKAREGKYKPVLTADQFKKYQENAAQMSQRGQGQGGGGQGQRPRNN